MGRAFLTRVPPLFSCVHAQPQTATKGANPWSGAARVHRKIPEEGRTDEAVSGWPVMDRQVTVMVDGERTFALPVPEGLVAGFLETVRDDAREHRNLAVVYVDTDPDTGDAEKIFDFRSGRHAEPSRPRPRLQRVLDYIERMLPR